MPMAQISDRYTMDIISMPARRLFLSMPSAEIIPNRIGTRHATRAEAVGMKKAKIAITAIMPARMRPGLVPIAEITLKATRLSRPVIDIAAAITSDAAMSATAELVNPASAADSAA